MTTRLTQRFSKIPKLTTPLQSDDTIVVTQTSGSTKKTVNTTVEEQYQYLQNVVTRDGLVKYVSVGFGLAGKGTAADPLRLDTAWLDQAMVRRDRLNITTVGERHTRYLPISRKKLFESEFIISTASPCLPGATVEWSGELKYIVPGANAFTASVGRWGADRNVNSTQLIQRKILPEGLPENKSIAGITGVTATCAMLVLRDKNNTIPDEYWIADLTDGSLNEEALTNLAYLGKYNNNPITDPFRNNSVSCFKIGNGRYVMSVVRSTDANAAFTIRCQKVVGTGASATLANISSWNSNSYAGIFTGQTTARISDKFLGTATEKCELVKAGTAAITAGFVVGNNIMNQIEVIQDPQNPEKLYLLARREVKLTSGTTSVKYTSDMTFTMTISAAGVGSLTAVSRYLGSKPTVEFKDGEFIYTNKRNTFVNDVGLTNELISVLKDGSIMLVTDKTTAAASGEIALYASPTGYYNKSVLDLHAAVTDGEFKEKQVLNVRPAYNHNFNPAYPLYISSPIKVYMGNMKFEIPAQVLDLTATINGQTAFNLGDLPYGQGAYSDMTVKAAFLYAQQSGTIGTLAISPRELTETSTNTLVAAIFFPVSGAPSLLFGQAYSRMHKNRLAYEPQGSAVPVSYDNPAQKPKDYWLQETVMGGLAPTFWKDEACTIPATLAINGKVLYIRVAGSSDFINRTLRMTFGDRDLGGKTYTGKPLVWAYTVSYNATQPTDTAVIVKDGATSNEIARNYITTINAPLVVDVVSSNGGATTLTQLQRNFTVYARVTPYEASIGDAITVTTSGSQSLNLGTLTYNGSPLYFTLKPTSAGTISLSAKNVKTNDTSPTLSLLVFDPVSEYGPGTYTLTVEPGHSINYMMVGGGGGGGGYVSNLSGNWNVTAHGGPGGTSKLSYLTTAIQAVGGGGGLDAHWFSETSYTIGTSGAGGTVTTANTNGFSVTKTIDGNSGAGRNGGSSVASFAPSSTNGRGGTGGGPNASTPTDTVTEVSVATLWKGATTTASWGARGFTVIRGFELYSAFVAAMGRAPKAGELVRVTVPSTHALIGADSGNVAGLTVGTSWPATAPVEIINYGAIVGVGGNAGDYKDPGGSTGHVLTNVRLPGAGIHNQSSATVTLQRMTNSVLYGGGGAGGSIPGELRRGGGGAPYGIGGKNYRQDGSAWPEDGRYGIDNGDDGTFSTGGNGGYYNSKNYGGRGGDWGAAGANGAEGIQNKVGYGQQPGAETIGVSTAVTRTTEVNITSLLNTSGSDTFGGKTYLLIRGVNLRTAFVNYYGRAPQAGELVKLTIPENVAVVGNTTVPQGILIPSNWEGEVGVEIINRGLIFGMGGQGNGTRYANGQPTIDGTDGSTGVKNMSSGLVKITNYGGVAGGGGGGARGVNYLQGGGGAPYGLKGVIQGVTTYPSRPATDAGFEKAGLGALDPSSSSRGGGDGGTVGTDGKTIVVSHLMNYYGNQYGTLAGYVGEGKVALTNQGSGWTLGRPIAGGSVEALVLGGGGGAGGYIEGKFTNTTSAAVKLTLVVGAGGAGWAPNNGTVGYASTAGAHGYAKITYN